MDGFKCEMQELIWKNLKYYSKHNLKAPLGYFSLMINLDSPELEHVEDYSAGNHKIFKDEGREF